MKGFLRGEERERCGLIMVGMDGWRGRWEDGGDDDGGGSDCPLTVVRGLLLC